MVRHGEYRLTPLTAPGGAELTSMDIRLQRLSAWHQHGRRKLPTSSTAADEVAVVAKISDIAAFTALSEVKPGSAIGDVARTGL